MTNIVGTIAVVLATNVTQIGTFHSDKGYGDFNVMEHKLQTNTVLMVEYEGAIRQFTLKSVDGPVLKEERVVKSWSSWSGLTFTNINNWHWNDATNLLLQGVGITG